MDTAAKNNLKKRYLIWLYKTTKEALDRIERKFTQLEIDRYLLRELRKADRQGLMEKSLLELAAYIRKKEEEGASLKFAGNGVKPEYAFLEAKLAAIEKAITKEFGHKQLAAIIKAYEEEMTGRILKSTEHG